MPAVSIEIVKKYSPDQEIALMKAVHSALAKAFEILNNDINTRLTLHEPHRFFVPELYTQPELYTHISIDCYAGRSLGVKRKLYQLIVENLEALGIPKDHVKIVLRETPQENWGIRGGKAGCDVEACYPVEI